MRILNIGLLAHVDAGKTTLAENILFTAGAIRHMGRVDHGDTYLDSNSMERSRGITIFSKQARFVYGDIAVTLLDTPGHVDFSSEMERVLSVIDLAVLIISGPEGVQSHTRTLWRLLEYYDIPTVIFVNKMDMQGTDREKILADLRENLSKTCADIEGDRDAALEEISMADEGYIEEYLETGTLSNESIKEAIAERLAFPVWFGSALKNEGVSELLDGIVRFSPEPEYGDEPEIPAETGGNKANGSDKVKEATNYSARVFKITKGSQGERLTHLKVTGGKISARMSIAECSGEKIDQIRLYNGEKYETESEAIPGEIVAVTGLSESFAGQGLGGESEKSLPVLAPVLRYKVIPENGENPLLVYGKLTPLGEEYPELSFSWNERHKEIFVNVNGEIQLQVLKRLVQERLGIEISYGAGSIVYKETIGSPSYGIGHFEPLRHYAEVQLLLKPGERGSGIEFVSACSTDMLDKNWQRLIRTHVEETTHPGTLTGSEVTDIRVILITGRAHPKHTEGGDFRQATYRAVRNALMQASAAGKGVLLEPIYSFIMTLPSQFIGKAMTDMDRMCGKTLPPELTGEGNTAVLKGTVPVRTSWEYAKELAAYTAGEGSIMLELAGYEPCQDQDSIVEKRDYDPEADLRRPPGSVFCAHGAGFQVPWDEVAGYAHMPCTIGRKDLQNLIENGACGLDHISVGYDGGSFGSSVETDDTSVVNGTPGVADNFSGSGHRDSQTGSHEEKFISLEEIDKIFASQHRNRKAEAVSRRKIYKRGKGCSSYHDLHSGVAGRSAGTAEQAGTISNGYGAAAKKNAPLPNCYLVDGYNMIHAWEELKRHVDDNIHGARERLIDICSEYIGIVGGDLILVFDAYLVPGGIENVSKQKNIYVVYTGEAETADQYIEKTTKKKARDFRVTVATSDHLEQLIVFSEGALRMSASEFEKEIERARKKLRDDYLDKKGSLGNVIPVEKIRFEDEEN